MFDIIGDIHGYASKLKTLLLKLGYRQKGNNFTHPTRKVCFLGDFIDRGPEILEVLTIVREMINSGNAYSVMGNHEYNYLAYHLFSTENQDYCRPHHRQHNWQISQTLIALKSLSKTKKKEWEKWFYSLPLYLEFKHFRLAHAFWHQPSIKTLQKLPCINQERYLTPESILLSNHFIDKNNSIEKQAIEMILKGPEYPLEKEFYFYDPEQNLRKDARIFWWKIPTSNLLYPQNKKSTLLKDVLHLPKEEKYLKQFSVLLPSNQPLPAYPLTEKILFFGHYWLSTTNKKAQILQPNATSLDYSVARNGYLSAYRYDNEQTLTADKFVLI